MLPTSEACGCGRAELALAAAPGGLEGELDAVLARFASAVEKADDDPLVPKEFLRMEARLVKKLRKAFGTAKEPFVERLRELLGQVDVARLDTVDHFVVKLAGAVRGLDRAVAAEVGPLLEAAVLDMYQMTKKSLVGSLLDAGKLVGSSLEAKGSGFGFKDERAVHLLNRHQTIYVQQGVRNALDDFDERVKALLTAGLEQGQTRKQLAGGLFEAFGSTVGSEDYWNIVGSAWVNRARNWSTLRTLDDVEIEHFVILAVMDERTSPFCRLMNGRTFEVKRQLDLMEEIAHDDDLDALKKRSPWLRSRVSERDEPEIGFVKGGRFTAIGQAGKLVLSESQIQAAGVALPPYHGLCRTTVGAL